MGQTVIVRKSLLSSACRVVGLMATEVLLHLCKGNEFGRELVPDGDGG